MYTSNRSADFFTIYRIRSLGKASGLYNRDNEAMTRHHWVFGLCLLAAGTAAAQQSAPLYGPIEARNLRSLQMPFFRFTLHGSTLVKGEREFQFVWNESNDFRVIRNQQHQEVLREDQETTRFTLSKREGLGHGVEIGIDVPIEFRGGGFMDPLINWWHNNLIHSPHPDRDATPTGQNGIRYPGGEFSGNQFGLGDVSLTVSKQFNHRFRGNLGFKVPTGDPGRFLGSGAPDAGVSFDYSAAINGNWTLQLMGGVIGQGKGTLRGARGIAHQEAAVLIWHPNSKNSFVGQWVSESAAIQTGIPTSDATHRTLMFAWQHRIAARTRLDLYFMEDRDFLAGAMPEVANIAPDFGIGIALKFRF